MTIDLGRVVIVNENSNPDRAGDVTLFENIADAESWLEPIDVQNGGYFAYLLDGRQLKLCVVKGRGIFSAEKVRIDPELPAQEHSHHVRYLLEAAGTAVLAARTRREGIEPELKPSSMSMVELVELIGFSR